jgi:hypothetical protein
MRPAPRDVSIWWWAFGYWASYVPYGALTKALSEGALPGMEGRVDGFSLLPANALASLAATMVFLGVTGWWREASTARVAGRVIPAPSAYAGVSGLCAATITVTTTLAYTIEGTSIVLMMLLMRGLVLALAPVIDLLHRRPVRARSWVALALSFAALLVAFRARGTLTMSAAAVVCLALYTGAYFVRLQVMSRAAKSDDGWSNRRFFVDEQLVCMPAVVVTLGLWAALGDGARGAALRGGFGEFFSRPYAWAGLLAGVCSQGTGIFGALVLLDRRENTFCIPVNRASSVLAGVCASLLLAALLPRMRLPATGDLVGALLMVTALVVLALPTRKEDGATPHAGH